MAQPFHAGGAIPTLHATTGGSSHGLLDLARAAAARWPSLAQLDLTRLGSLIAIAGVVPGVWRLLHRAWHETYAWVRAFFVASVTIPGRDPLNKTVVSWVVAHVVEPRRSTRFFTARTGGRRDDHGVGGSGGGDGAAADGKTQQQQQTRRQRGVQYLPHFETVWFVHAGRVFVLHRSLDSFSASLCDPGYEGVGGEELTLSCLGRAVAPIQSLIGTCRAWADLQTQYFVVVYARDRYGISWQPRSRKPVRRLETVHFDEGTKAALLADIQKYLDPETQRRYRTRSMPYRRGYLFYGPPGTGKSSLSTALAGEFGLDLYEVKIPSVASDADLEQMFQEIPPQCIVLLEDIDAVWTADRNDVSDREDRSGSGSRTPGSNCTLSGLLNVLDGVGSQEGRIVIMTTNKPERLDSALVRPGRVDMKVHLGSISRKSAEQMFLRMFAPDTSRKLHLQDEARRGTSTVGTSHLHEMALEFSKHIPEGALTPSQLQGFFQLHLDSAAEAAASIEAWVAKEVTSTALDEDIEIINQTARA